MDIATNRARRIVGRDLWFLVVCTLLLPALSSQAQVTTGPQAQARASAPATAPVSTDAAPRAPQGVQAYRDLAYVSGGHVRQKLDLYVPQNAPGPWPVIIWIHGGGWQNGSKEGCPPLRSGYTDLGYAVASLNYRLTDAAPFPAQIEDCKAALRFLRAHAGEYHLDPRRFGVWGSSAGGHLVALLGASGDEKEFDVGENLDQSSRVQAVCDYYGPADFAAFVATPGYTRHAAADAPESKLLGGTVAEKPDVARRASPVTFVSADDPPFLIVHGDHDGTVPIQQSRLLYAALQQAGVRVHFHTIHGAGHGTGFGGPEIAPMVRTFFDTYLKASPLPSNLGPADTSDSNAPAAADRPGAASANANSPATRPASAQRPLANSPGGAAGNNITWEQVRRREGAAADGRVLRAQFKGPPALFDRLDRNGDGALAQDDFPTSAPTLPAAPGTPVSPAGSPAPAPTTAPTSQTPPDSAPPTASSSTSTGTAAAVATAPPTAAPDTAMPATTPQKRPPRDPAAGVFFYAQAGYETNLAALANPGIIGNWVQFYWSDIEKAPGQYDWTLIDARMQPWVAAGKKVALRVYWVGSGYWRDPGARTATPAWVWAQGATCVRHGESGTEVPLAWDPIYERCQLAFLAALARRYDNNPDILFIDVTPGAETNPYRLGAFAARAPDFKEQYAAAVASDGRPYSDELWLATVHRYFDAVDKIFLHTPLVITLNVGSLNLDGGRQDHFLEIGQDAVDHGFYVGQNGLSGKSYLRDSPRQAAFLRWAAQTRLVFEAGAAANTTSPTTHQPTGSLRELVEAARRVHASYLLPYPADVLAGTAGQPTYDPAHAAALQYAAQTLGRP